MMKSLSAFLLAALALALPAQARMGGNFGLGVQVGEPVAVAGKLWLNQANALDMAFGFSARHDYILLQCDYLFHHYNVIPVGAGELPLYYGMGVTVVASGSPAVGAQGVLGLAYHFPSAPLDLFLDLSPGIIIIPEPDENFGLALGMRFYF